VGYSLSQNPNDAASLKEHLETRRQQGWEEDPKHLIGDAGYGSEENYELLKAKKIEAYVKYPSWYREATGKVKKFEKAAFQYDESNDEFICPAGRRLVRMSVTEVKRQSGYVTEKHQYGCLDCSGCQWKKECTRGTGNRTLDHLPRLAAHQKEVGQKLTSEKGIEFRKRRGWEVETPFAMMKKNLGFVRIHLRGMAKATLEIGYLMIALNLMRWASVEG